LSGGADSADPKGECKELKRVMKRFGVDEKTAHDIMLYALNVGQEKFERWRKNTEAVRKKLNEQAIY
jgi:hypothetical protein